MLRSNLQQISKLYLRLMVSKLPLIYVPIVSWLYNISEILQHRLLKPQSKVGLPLALSQIILTVVATYDDLNKDYEKYCLTGKNKKYAPQCRSTVNALLFFQKDEVTVLKKGVIPELHILQDFENYLFWNGLICLLGLEIALIWPKKLNVVAKNYHGRTFSTHDNGRHHQDTSNHGSYDNPGGNQSCRKKHRRHKYTGWGSDVVLDLSCCNISGIAEFGRTHLCFTCGVPQSTYKSWVRSSIRDKHPHCYAQCSASSWGDKFWWKWSIGYFHVKCNLMAMYFMGDLFESHQHEVIVGYSGFANRGSEPQGYN